MNRVVCMPLDGRKRRSSRKSKGAKEDTANGRRRLPTDCCFGVFRADFTPHSFFLHSRYWSREGTLCKQTVVYYISSADCIAEVYKATKISCVFIVSSLLNVPSCAYVRTYVFGMVCKSSQTCFSSDDVAASLAALLLFEMMLKASAVPKAFCRKLLLLLSTLLETMFNVLNNEHMHSRHQSR